MIIDTDFAGSVTAPIRVDLVVIFRSAKVFTVADRVGVNPRTEIVVVSEFVRFMFTALIKIVLPLRLAVASRYGLLTSVASRTSPRCVL